METQEERIARDFLSQAVAHLEEEFLPKIRKCLALLDEEDVWWRGSEAENSIGNILLHLSGNVRQWIISGLGGAPDRRERSKEFSARRSVNKADAIALLESTVTEASTVLQKLQPQDLLAGKSIQGFNRTGLQAIFHVVEHFSYHTGQIVYITKLRKPQDLRFYNL